jgi:hypothetical protein
MNYLTKIYDISVKLEKEDKRMAALYKPILSQVMKMFYGGYYASYFSGDNRREYTIVSVDALL